MKTLLQGLVTVMLAASPLAMAGNGVLLGRTVDYPRINYTEGSVSQGAFYDGTSLIITATPVFVTFTSTGAAEFITGSGLSITANINSAGTFSGGTFSLSGTVDDTATTTTYTGVLLSGTVADYGIVDIGATDLADFKLVATGGSLLPRMGGSDTSMLVSLESSGFAGSFASNWSADRALGDVGPQRSIFPMPCFNISDLTVKDRSGTLNDEVHLSKGGFRLPAPNTLNLATDTVKVTVDGLVVSLPPGSFVQRAGHNDFTYNTASGVKPKIEMRLNFEKNTWELDFTKGDVSLITTADGVDVTLLVGAYESTAHVTVSHHSGGHSDSTSQSHPPTCRLTGTSSDDATPGIGKLSSIAGLTLRTPSGSYSRKARASAGVTHPNTAYVDESTGELAIVNTSGGVCLRCGDVVTGTSGGAFTIMKVEGRPGDTLARKCGVSNASCSILPAGQ